MLLIVSKLSSRVLIDAWGTWTGRDLPEHNKLPNNSDTLLQLSFAPIWKVKDKDTPADSQKTCKQPFAALVSLPPIKVEIRKKFACILKIPGPNPVECP